MPCINKCERKTQSIRISIINAILSYWRGAKEWIKRRNKLKDIDSLKKAYKEQIGVIESYEYLKGCYKILSYSGSFLNAMQDFSNSIINKTLCNKFERYHWGYSILYSLLDPQKRRESLYEEIKEKKD